MSRDRLESFAFRAMRSIPHLVGQNSRLLRPIRPLYEAYLDRLSEGRGVPFDINGVTYRIDRQYRPQLCADYEAPVARFLRDRVQPGATCLDVGANVGAYVLQFAYWSRPTGRVIAFEPNPGACAILQKHIQYNRLTDRVVVVPVAVGATGGASVLFARAAHEASRLGEPPQSIADDATAIEVPVVSLDDYCASTGTTPDWLFIDIEGFEIAALAGARQLIRSRGAALGIVLELHPPVWAAADTTREDLESLLLEMARKPVPLTGQKSPLDEYGVVYLEPVEGHAI